MRLFILLFVATLLVQKDSAASANTPAGGDPKDLTASSPLLGALSRSNRKSRCVRCYDDRGYEGYDADAGSRYGSYSYRRGLDDRDERGSSYYQYPSYRGGSSDYDRYSGGGGGAGGGSYYRDRDDRYSPRSYYDEGRRYEGGRYYDRGGSADSRYYYDNNNYRDNRYSGGAGDRYYDRSRQVYDRDYDRYAYPRYDYRNYRPFDETYRGQSGFDNSGRGYYFAGDQNAPQRPAAPRCSTQVLNCPYQSTTGTQVTSQPIAHSDIPMQAPHNNRSQNGWRHIQENEQPDKPSRERDRDDQQSSSYGGRPPRPLGGSYLFDRDSNVAGGNAMVDTKTDSATTTNNNNNHSQQQPEAQAQTAEGPKSSSQPAVNKKP